MKHFFYDTCSLLYEGSYIFNHEDKFYISNITLK